jgi:hypothetical protein
LLASPPSKNGQGFSYALDLRKIVEPQWLSAFSRCRTSSSTDSIIGHFAESFIELVLDLPKLPQAYFFAPFDARKVAQLDKRMTSRGLRRHMGRGAIERVATTSRLQLKCINLHALAENEGFLSLPEMSAHVSLVSSVLGRPWARPGAKPFKPEPTLLMQRF